jgi:hypothetical protein
MFCLKFTSNISNSYNILNKVINFTLFFFYLLIRDILNEKYKFHIQQNNTKDLLKLIFIIPQQIQRSVLLIWI